MICGNAVMEEAIVDEKKKCGWLLLTPASLQKFRTPKWALFWLSCAAAVQGMIINGFISVVITTIERQYGLKSSESGLVAGMFTIAGLFFLVPVSYFGGRPNASKPKYIGIGLLILGVGSLLFASPHFISGTTKTSKQSEHVCQKISNITSQPPDSCDELLEQSSIEQNHGLYLSIFLIAQFLHGAGSAPLFTLGVTYLDENVSTKMSSIYLGIYFMMAIVGPGLGYWFGGQLLDINTNFLTLDLATLALNTDSNVWIGAWWVSFVAGAILCFVIAIPVLAFPAALPGSEKLAKDKISETHQKSTSSSESIEKGEISTVEEFFQALKDLLTNPAFFMLNLAGASDGLLITGFSTFLPKLIENQFSISATEAALLIGIATIPAGGIGTFLGGYLVKYWNLTCSGILKFCIYSTAISIIFNTAFAFSCRNLDFAGLTVRYSDNNASLLRKDFSLESPCNKNCSCLRSEFNPVCGVDNFIYYSPCHAGCTQEITVDEKKVYQDCTCIDKAAKNMTTLTGMNVSYNAINTKCNSTCTHLWLFIFLIFGAILTTFLCSLPSLFATLRVVKDDQRSFATGINSIKIRIFGMAPAPVIFGVLIDQACILWQDTCDGSCLVYDNSSMNKYMLILGSISKIISLIFYIFAWWFYVPPVNNKLINELEQQKISMSLTNNNSVIKSLS